MCGNHDHDGNPVDHDHHGERQRQLGRVFFPRPQLRSRRAFLGEVGAGTLAMAVLTPTVLAACSSTNDTQTSTVTAAETDADSSAEPTATSAPAVAADDSTADAPALVWAQASLGFVSAYVLARGNRAAIVDTGVAGSAAAIGQSLASLGLNYSDVEHVILTHHHQDHAGSIDAVLAEATNATAWVGEADVDELGGRALSTVVGGEDVFGFEMVSTPGHTAGHMCVIDHSAGLLVAGDAIFTNGGGVTEGPAQFFDDIPESRESIKTLASLSFNTLLVGHGAPIESAADTAVAELAASFG